jgi:hypothetical protein
MRGRYARDVERRRGMAGLGLSMRTARALRQQTSRAGHLVSQAIVAHGWRDDAISVSSWNER